LIKLLVRPFFFEGKARKEKKNERKRYHQITKYRKKLKTKRTKMTASIATTRNFYTQLTAHLRSTSVLASISGILEWDQQVLMPSGASDLRSSQLSVLAGMTHDRATDPKIGTILNSLEKDGLVGLNDWEKANVREAKREYFRQVKVPKELVEKLKGLQSQGYTTWVSKMNHCSFFVSFVFLHFFFSFRLLKKELI